MRAKSALLLVLALGCGLVAAIGVTQVISRNPEPSNLQGDIRSIIVAAKDIVPGELITPQMVKLEPWPKEKTPDDSLTEIAKVDGCRARDEIYQGEPIRERQLLGQGYTARTATDYIPKGYRVVGVKVDMVSGAGLIRPGDRVDVLVHFTKDANKGVLENRTQTILQDIKVFAVDDIFKPDPGQDERDTVQAKVIQLLVTPVQAESLVLAQQLGKVQLTMRPPGGEDVMATPGKTPAELLGGTSAGDRTSEASPIDPTQSGGGLLDFLNNMKKKPTATTTATPAQQPATPNASNDVWNMRVLSGPELSDVFMEGSVDPSGEPIWRVSPLEPSTPEPAQTQDAPAQDAPTQDAPAPAVEPSPAPPAEPAPSDASDTTSEQPKE